tara:strand:- start:165 stop:434 length:270 start_codon:yes stop_codon:yes gene_type:complete
MENNSMNFTTRENLLALIQSKIKEQEKYLSHDSEDKKLIKNKQIEELKRILMDLDEIKKTKDLTYDVLNRLQKQQNNIIKKIKYISDTL